MVHLASADVTRCERQLATEEEGDREMTSTNHSHGDGLSPAHVCRRDGDLDVRGIEAGGAQFHSNAVADNRVILTTFSGDTGSNSGGRLLADPDMNQAAQLDNAKQNRQQHERHNQHGLERFLPTLPPTTPRSPHDVCVSRCTIWPILATKPLFQAMMPTTSVPRMMAAPITHSRVDCPRFKVFKCSLQ